MYRSQQTRTTAGIFNAHNPHRRGNKTNTVTLPARLLTTCTLLFISTRRLISWFSVFSNRVSSAVSCAILCSSFSLRTLVPVFISESKAWKLSRIPLSLALVLFVPSTVLPPLLAMVPVPFSMTCIVSKQAGLPSFCCPSCHPRTSGQDFFRSSPPSLLDSRRATCSATLVLLTPCLFLYLLLPPPAAAAARDREERAADKRNKCVTQVLRFPGMLSVVRRDDG